MPWTSAWVIGVLLAGTREAPSALDVETVPAETPVSATFKLAPLQTRRPLEVPGLGYEHYLATTRSLSLVPNESWLRKMANQLAVQLRPKRSFGSEVLEWSEVLEAGVKIPLGQQVQLQLETSRGIRRWTYWDARAVLSWAIPDVAALFGAAPCVVDVRP
jgi:hypothetical protein